MEKIVAKATNLFLFKLWKKLLKESKHLKMIMGDNIITDFTKIESSWKILRNKNKSRIDKNPPKVLRINEVLKISSVSFFETKSLTKISDNPKSEKIEKSKI